MVAMGAFCVAWNLLEARTRTEARITFRDPRLLAGLLAAALMVVLGNLGTVRMIYQGLQRLAAPGGVIDGAGIVQRLIWMTEGVGQVDRWRGAPVWSGEWYWDPSRVIPPGPGNEITEFPFFTFLYSDLHAHMLAMPVALLALVWALSVIKGRGITLFSIVIGAITIGALYPTNLSDIYTYLPIGFAVLGYSIWRSNAPIPRRPACRIGSGNWR